ncbi:hypothetical protein [Sanyastnella coralliicola]|uniref:hypothetical protein n=1 Tax=Sanyastnella coralliicola TaxID=3069118 RepID=UPI0027B99339|nr:hypothetical protein [Longitalea sp. SCSIO 12813]
MQILLKLLPHFGNEDVAWSPFSEANDGVVNADELLLYIGGFSKVQNVDFSNVEIVNQFSGATEVNFPNEIVVNVNDELVSYGYSSFTWFMHSGADEVPENNSNQTWNSFWINALTESGPVKLFMVKVQ